MMEIKTGVLLGSGFPDTRRDEAVTGAVTQVVTGARNGTRNRAGTRTGTGTRSKIRTSISALPGRGTGIPGLGAGLCLLVLAAVVMASCSSLPTGTAEPVQMGIKAQAADLVRQGDDNMAARNWPLAEDCYRRAYEMGARVDNLEGMAQARNSLGYLYIFLGKPGEAKEVWLEAMDIALLSADKGLITLCRVNLAKAALALKRIPEALELLVLADKERPSDDRKLQAVILHSKAVALRDSGDAQGARSLLAQAMVINKDLGLLRETASNHYLLASLENQAGEKDLALANLLQALELDKKAEADDAIPGDLFALAKVYQSRAKDTDLAASRDYAWRAFQAGLAGQDTGTVKKALELLLALDSASGRTADAQRWKTYLDKLELQAGNSPPPGKNPAGSKEKQ